MGAAIDPKEHDLPDLVGGWSLERYAVTRDASVDLFVPREPDALLDDVEVQERNRYNDSMPYWAWVWDSAPVLARQVAEDLGDRSRPARVLEVGAGLGLVGLGVAAALGPRAEVLLTDHDPDAVRALEAQIVKNGATRTRAMHFDWNEPRALAGERFDVVIGCDVTYEARSHEPLLGLLGSALDRDGVAWFGDPGRTRAPGFVRRAEAAG
ncbi:MAG: methyltransferase, partial [Planctomycetota bacterium]